MVTVEILDLQNNDYDETHTNGTTNGSTDTAFRKIQKNSAAFLIWRIENMGLVNVPKDQFGTFCDSDSYVIYAASSYGQPSGIDTVPREIRGTALEYHIHFWLGKCTTPEKSGVAAYKTVELDNILGNCTIQHRESEGNESARFLSYYKNGLRIIKSDTIKTPILYKIIGNRTGTLIQLDNISWNQFNSSDIFLLQTETYLFVWVGRSAEASSKIYVSKLVLELKTQNNITNIVFVDDGYEKTMQENDRKEFNKILPLEKRHILPENNDESFRTTPSIRLYKCAENNGKYRVTELKTGPIRKDDLESQDVFIIDQESEGIWIWAGKKSNDKEKNEALRNARGFVKKKKYPNNTKVTRVVEGYEPSEFKMLFPSWSTDHKSHNKLTALTPKFSAETMYERTKLSAELQLIDDGSGHLTLWRVMEKTIVEITKERHGLFFAADCYLILYNYHIGNQEKNLLYCWLGSKATQEDITTATIKCGELENELDNLVLQARVIEGQEPAHLLQLFKGKLIVFKGQGTDYDDTGRNMKHPNQYLLQIYGSTTYTTKGLEVPQKTTFLDSNYCFVLRKGKHAHIWCGAYSTGDQREMAKGFVAKHFELLMEGKEKTEFFDLLGGKNPYQIKLIKNIPDQRPARLFRCIKGRNLKVEEIMFFTQNDLLPECVMLLDYFCVIYVWIGNLSSKEDQRISMKTAIEYMQTDPSGRDLNTTIIHVYQGSEPPTFTGFFPTWDCKLWKDYKSFGAIRNDIENMNLNGVKNENNNNIYRNSGHNDFDQYDKYPVDILKETNEKLPAKVDALNKELHLTHDDFVSIFKLTYLDFEKLPKWKQQELKKKVGLF